MSDLDNQIIAFKDSMAKSISYATGDANTDVQTPNGLIPSIAKQAKTNAAIIAALLPAINNRLRIDVIDLTMTAQQKVNAKGNIGLDQVDNTADAQKPISVPQKAAIDALAVVVNAKEDPTNKNSENGYVGIAAWKLVVRNLANTFTNFLSASTTASRSWLLPDKSGTIALTSDITGTNTGINTGDETGQTILSKLGSTNLSGNNTGDETKSSILAKLGYTPVAPTEVITSVLTTYVAGLPGTVNNNDTVGSAITKLQTQLGGVTATNGQSEVIANKATDFTVLDDVHYPTTKAVTTYVESRIVGILSDRGSFSATSGSFPTANGSGTGGIILKGNLWFVSVAGTLGGVQVHVGDSVRALVDSPGQLATNWSVLESNLGYVPYNATNPAGYTANQTDAYLLNRNNHTGTQAADTITETATRVFVSPTDKASIAHNNRAALDQVSGVNSGDETSLSIRTKLNITTISGINTGDQTLTSLGAEDKTKKDASDGYAGLTGFAINMKDITGAVMSMMRNTNTAIRTYTFPDKSGTVAMMDDVEAVVSGGAETQSSILTKLGATKVTGSNTGDQTITLTGDVTGTGTGNFVTTLANNIVSFAKMVAIPTGMFLGRSSTGSGNIEAMPVSTVKALLSVDQVDNTPDASKPVSAAQGNAIALKESTANKATDFSVANDVKFPTTQAVKTVTDAMKAGMLFDCGDYDPSSNGGKFPTAGGTGDSGAIKRGNVFRISTAATLGGKAVKADTTVRALIDTPAQVLANWKIEEAPLFFNPVNKAGDTLSGALVFSIGAAVPSAATLNLDASTGNIVDVTGTTDISAITLAAGGVRYVRFRGVLNLVYGANTIRLPAGKNLLTADGDQAVFIGTGTGVSCSSYMRANGTPVLPVGQDTVRSINANTSATSLDLNNGDNATTFKVTVSVNTTLTFTNPPPSPNGEIFSFTLIVTNDSTAGRAMAFGNAIQWAGGQLPARTTSAYAVDVWTFYVDNGVYTGSLAIADKK